MQIQNKVREMEMKTTIILILVALIATSAMAARVVNKSIEHPPFLVYQAYCGQTCTPNINGCFQGFSGQIGDTISAVPGILCIDPGETAVKGLPEPGVDWTNYVTASQPGGPPAKTDGSVWKVTNTSLRKTVPTYDCTVAIGGAAVLQQGSANIRKWWPLMYELPGTKWVLIVTTGTAVWDDDGAGPNLAATTHQDTWTWQVDATLASLKNLVKLFHELPVGSCQVPLIASESLYTQLIDSITALEAFLCPDPADPTKLIVCGDQAEFTELFNAFIMLIEDNCSTDDCGQCNIDYPIRNTVENPACCKLLADADFILDALQAEIPAK